MTGVSKAHRPPRWLPSTIAAAAILGLVALALAVLGGGHPSPAAQPSAAPGGAVAAAVVGPPWRLIRLRDGFGTMTVAPDRDRHRVASLSFTANGELEGNDGVNGNGARYEIARDGYVVRGPVMGGGVGFAGPTDSPTARIRGAIDACSTDLGAHVTLEVHANTMTLHAGGRTLVLVRTYPVPRH